MMKKKPETFKDTFFEPLRKCNAMSSVLVYAQRCSRKCKTFYDHGSRTVQPLFPAALVVSGCAFARAGEAVVEGGDAG